MDEQAGRRCADEHMLMPADAVNRLTREQMGTCSGQAYEQSSMNWANREKNVLAQGKHTYTPISALLHPASSRVPFPWASLDSLEGGSGDAP